MTLRIGIVSFCYGNAAGIIEGLNSVDVSEGKIVSWTLVDDGSPDPGNRQLLREWAESRTERVNLFLHEQNAGLVVRMNEVLEILDCDYIKGCADDVFLPGALDKMIRVAEAQNYPDVITGIGQWYNEDLTKPMAAFWGVLGKEAEYPVLLKAGDLRDRMFRGNFISAPSTMWKLSSLKKWGGYDSDFVFEDWPLWMKVCVVYSQSRVAFLSEVIVKYRRLRQASVAVSPAKKVWREKLEVEKVVLRLKYGNSRTRSDREIAYQELAKLRWRAQSDKERALYHCLVAKWFPVSRFLAYSSKGKTYALGPLVAHGEGVVMRLRSRLLGSN